MRRGGMGLLAYVEGEVDTHATHAPPEVRVEPPGAASTVIEPLIRRHVGCHSFSSSGNATCDRTSPRSEPVSRYSSYSVRDRSRVNGAVW